MPSIIINSLFNNKSAFRAVTITALLFIVQNANAQRDSMLGAWRLVRITDQRANVKGADSNLVLGTTSDRTEIGENAFNLVLNFFANDSFKSNTPLIEIYKGARHFDGKTGVFSLDTTNRTLLLTFSQNYKALFLLKHIDSSEMHLVYVTQNWFDEKLAGLKERLLTYYFRKQ